MDMKLVRAALLCALLAGCGDGDQADAGSAADTLSRAERDSILGQSTVPGGSAVGRALETSDIAAERAAQMDSIEP